MFYINSLYFVRYSPSFIITLLFIFFPTISLIFSFFNPIYCEIDTAIYCLPETIPETSVAAEGRTSSNIANENIENVFNPYNNIDNS